MYIWTYIESSNGGGEPRRVKAEVLRKHYTLVEIGHGYKGMLIQNPFRKCWHLAMERGGALLGTKTSQIKLLRSVKEEIGPVVYGAMLKVVKDSEMGGSLATEVSAKAFFFSFVGYDARQGCKNRRRRRKKKIKKKPATRKRAL